VAEVDLHHSGEVVDEVMVAEVADFRYNINIIRKEVL
jgi:hypothetical protein